MTTHSNHRSHALDYETMWEVLWRTFPLLAVAAFVLWLVIP